LYSGFVTSNLDISGVFVKSPVPKSDRNLLTELEHTC
jgi:hypothetical protein